MRVCGNCRMSNYLIFEANLVSCPFCRINSDAANELTNAMDVGYEVEFTDKLFGVSSTVYIVKYKFELVWVIEHYLGGVLYVDPKTNFGSDNLAILQKGVYEAWGVLMVQIGDRLFTYSP